MRARSLSVVLVVAACGGPSGSGDPDGSIDPTIDAAVEPGWTTLIERSWSLNSKFELHKCKVIQVPEDMYITGYRLVAPTGTHHTLLTSPTSATIGEVDCSPPFDPQMLYAGGIGTQDVVFPPGVAIKLAAGQYLRLTLHVYNASDNTISGTSGIQVKTVPASQVTSEGDMIFLGNISNWSIPATNTDVTIAGSCSAPTNWHLFQLWPHMHNYATHQKVTVRRTNGTTQTLLDQAYNVTEQRMYGMGDTLIATNEMLEVTCTYRNNTNVTAPPGYPIPSGDGSTAEMCLTGMLKYPKGAQSMYHCASQ